MFSGIVDHIGSILEIKKLNNRDVRLIISTKFKKKDINLGSSICCNGACLTVTSINKIRNSLNLSFDVSKETFDCTNFSQLKIKSLINLEKSLRLGDEISGHFVSGHIDEVIKLAGLKKHKGSHIINFSIPRSLKKLIAKKGSISLNGVSLTVNKVTTKLFSVNIVPYTWEHTNFSSLKIGSRINVEVDMLARYVTQNLK